MKKQHFLILYIILSIQQQMNCPKCDMAYNKSRKPLVLTCGHTFCSTCISLTSTSKCYTCGNSSKGVINFALYDQLTKQMLKNIDKFIKVCLFGNMAVGKTSILKRLMDNQFEIKTTPTIGIDFKYADQQVGDKTYRFQIWDSAGQERYRAMSSDHLKGSDIILLVYDVSSNYLQNDLSFWIYEIQKYAQHNNTILIGNKTDLVNQDRIDLKDQSKQVMQKKQCVENQQCLRKEERQIVKQNGWEHLKTSCLSNEGINELWDILKKVSITSTGTTAEQKSKSIVLGAQSKLSTSKNEKKKCC